MSEIKEQIVEQATHLLDWLPGAYDHCKYGSREWCDGYLSNAVEVIQSQAARIKVLEEALREAADRAANVAQVHSHHALWGGLLPYGWSAETEKFGAALADKISTAIREDARLSLKEPHDQEPRA